MIGQAARLRGKVTDQRHVVRDGALRPSSTIPFSEVYPIDCVPEELTRACHW